MKVDMNALYVGLDEGNKRLLFIRPQTNAADELQVRTTLVQRFGVVNMYTTLRDAHIYVFHHGMVEFLVDHPDLCSLREDVLPLLVQLQSSKRMFIESRITSCMFCPRITIYF